MKGFKIPSGGYASDHFNTIHARAAEILNKLTTGGTRWIQEFSHRKGEAPRSVFTLMDRDAPLIKAAFDARAASFPIPNTYYELSVSKTDPAQSRFVIRATDTRSFQRWLENAKEDLTAFVQNSRDENPSIPRVIKGQHFGADCH